MSLLNYIIHCSGFRRCGIRFRLVPQQCFVTSKTIKVKTKLNLDILVTNLWFQLQIQWILVPSIAAFSLQELSQETRNLWRNLVIFHCRDQDLNEVPGTLLYLPKRILGGQYRNFGGWACRAERI